MNAYFDNAATTPLDPEVLEAMLPIMKDQFGNPSSIHSYGRKVRSVLERARKSIAAILNAAPAEIFFTSGGTEADNTAILSSVATFGLTRAITSRLEHHAVLHTLEFLAKAGQITLQFVKTDEMGQVDLSDLERLLAGQPRTLVSLMHGNNELGNLLNIEEAGEICARHQAIFHCDTVQTMGHYPHDLQALKTHFIVGSAHKFHGPKGVGFLYMSPEAKLNPFIHGGAQERNMRGGTENVYGIVGMAKALEIAYRDMDAHRKHIQNLKGYMMERLAQRIDGVSFNGLSADLDKSLYTVLSVSLPESDISDMLLFNLDIDGIAVSGGSACASGTDVGSHVLNELYPGSQRANVRFSFSKYNTEAEVDYAVEKLALLYP
ncbi:cysteine desulfurase family protein [Dyadobacter tibetensis]|uniref:cysteine desulfurase family protein n=1 Tax=Dyadobacter tibetensis TaxID=1211851 RepID=UPI00046FAF17|nr:cysteine desulfurase family protein [Dyadobacter tibetensis]